MIHYTSDDELRAITDGLVDHTLPHAAWTHAAHWAAAFWLLKTRDAYADMPGIIRAYNTSVGTPNSDTEGYHETITIASLRAAEAAIKAAPVGEALCETLNRFLAGPYGRTDWILAHWSKETLFTPEARRRWIAPDKSAPAWMTG